MWFTHPPPHPMPLIIEYNAAKYSTNMKNTRTIVTLCIFEAFLCFLNRTILKLQKAAYRILFDKYKFFASIILTQNLPEDILSYSTYF